MRPALLVLSLLTSALPLAAQQTSLVYRLGKDTVAVEQYTRTANRIVGEMLQRNGVAFSRIQYDMTVGTDGRAMAATIRRLQPDGMPLLNTFSETRFRFSKDSVFREIVWPDSVQRRAFAASKALVSFPTFVYGPTEFLAAIRRVGGAVDSIPALSQGGNIGYTGLTPMGGDTLRLRGGAYAMLLRFDANARLLSVDGSNTTNKSVATRERGGLDMTAMARTMTPMGALSLRDVARGAFGQGGIVLVDYGRPLVRERSVWGGTLIPFDSIWRTGANDATHLFTTRTLTMGTFIVPAGMYTLWVQHTRTGTLLIVNKQTGQWGTVYDSAHDVGRVPMQLTPTLSQVEQFTITVKSLAPTRGALEFAWGPSVASVPFSTSIPKP